LGSIGRNQQSSGVYKDDDEDVKIEMVQQENQTNIEQSNGGVFHDPQTLFWDQSGEISKVVVNMDEVLIDMEGSVEETGSSIDMLFNLAEAVVYMEQLEEQKEAMLEQIKVAKPILAESEEEVVEDEIKTSFDLKLVGFDRKSRIKVMKEVRAIGGLRMIEAKKNR